MVGQANRAVATIPASIHGERPNARGREVDRPATRRSPPREVIVIL